MICAKEGSRTPTRVTPLEPEGTAPQENNQTYRDLAAILWSNMRPQNAARNRTSPQNCGACTAWENPDSDDDSGSWSTVPSASGRAPIAVPPRLGCTLYWPRLG